MIENDRLIAGLDQAREEMREVLRELDAAREVYPSWTVKELLAHITGWDDAGIAALRSFARGEPPATPAARGFDPFNASTVREREPLSLTQVTAEWEQTRETFKQAIRDLPAERLSEPFVLPWAARGSVADLVQILAEHEEEHAREVRKKARG